MGQHLKISLLGGMLKPSDGQLDDERQMQEEAKFICSIFWTQPRERRELLDHREPRQEQSGVTVNRFCFKQNKSGIKLQKI